MIREVAVKSNAKALTTEKEQNHHCCWRNCWRNMCPGGNGPKGPQGPQRPR